MSDRLYAREKGRGGAAVVMLHGFGGHQGDWIDIQPQIARDRLVLAYDLPGHGRSVGFPGAGSASGAARAVLADLAVRGVLRAHVVGFSMGGAIATLMAMQAPESVASLTLLAPGGFGPEINGPLLRKFAASRTADELRIAMDEMSAPGFRTPTRNVAGLAAIRFASGVRDKMLEVIAIIARDRRQGQIPREALANLAMPVSVVWGTGDPVLPYAQSDGLPDHFRLHTIQGAGHMLAVEALKTVTSVIRGNSRSG